MRKLERMGRRMFDWLVVLAVILSVYSAFNAVHANIFEDQDQTERCGNMAGQVLLFGYSRDQGLTHADVREAAVYAAKPGHEKAAANQVNFVYKFHTLSRKELAIAWFTSCVNTWVK